MNKRLFWLVTMLIILGLVAACGSADTAAPEPVVEEKVPVEEAEPAEEVTEPVVEEAEAPAEAAEAGESGIKMAILLSGTVDDLSWNYQMQQAAQKLAAERGIELDISEKVPPAEAERVIREYADNGFNFIITHSFGYGEALFKVAEEYPDVVFAWPGGIERTAENIADYNQPFYQAAYLMGIMAGGMSESGILSFLAGFDIPVCHSMMEAFKLGAQETNPDAEVLYTFTGDWVDVAKAKEAVLAHFDVGADYVASCGFGPTQGAIEAAQDREGFASSYVGDMSSIAPDTVALSMVWDLYPLLSLMVDDIEAGNFKPGKFYDLGVAEDALTVEINPALADQVPAEAQEKAESVRQSIIDGSFEVPYVPQSQ